ncbi:MAG: M28 family peptidase [Saprospiraceae bacterium]|nr:M28 family peptidase [Saprospiraceae bacterium]
MKKILTCLCFALPGFWVAAQTNILSTNLTAEQVLLGNYSPATYLPSVVVNHPDDIVPAILNGVSPDSLKAYLLEMIPFENRNTGADTLSAVTGIGAARRWVHRKFSEISVQNEGRLLPSYLQFDQNICNSPRHRNIFAVLPGIDTSAHGVVLIEAHIDSRCAGECDINCPALGMEDNGSGTALVLELARVMSRLAFDRTIVFLITIGEEQGLLGAEAFATYCSTKGIPIRAVLNNDVVGGIICGATSSQPSCPGFNHIDSTQVRLFSAGSFNSRNKQLSRFIKLEYIEEALDLVAVPMMITIMSAEDRTGRGGDHIPFREQGFAAMRFTSANEHGNANVSSPSYHDRQHTSDDILGVDTDGDSVLDSFFVDFNYLSRNTVINGIGAAMAAIGPVTPDFQAVKNNEFATVDITDPLDYNHYRVFVRSTTHDFDTIYTTFEKQLVFSIPSGIFYVSVASVDANGIESLFSKEVLPGVVSATNEPEAVILPAVELLQNRPNPFDEATVISFLVNREITYREAVIQVSDLAGKVLWYQKLDLKTGMNEVLYEHGYNVTGVYAYSLIIDGELAGTRQMIFAN